MNCVSLPPAAPHQFICLSPNHPCECIGNRDFKGMVIVNEVIRVDPCSVRTCVLLEEVTETSEIALSPPC